MKTEDLDCLILPIHTCFDDRKETNDDADGTGYSIAGSNPSFPVPFSLFPPPQLCLLVAHGWDDVVGWNATDTICRSRQKSQSNKCYTKNRCECVGLEYKRIANYGPENTYTTYFDLNVRTLTGAYLLSSMTFRMCRHTSRLGAGRLGFFVFFNDALIRDSIGPRRARIFKKSSFLIWLEVSSPPSRDVSFFIPLFIIWDGPCYYSSRRENRRLGKIVHE